MTTAADAVKIFQIALKGYEIINGLIDVGHKTGINPAPAIKNLIKSLQDGFSGATSPDIVEADLKAMIDSLAQNDAVADAGLKQKFDTSDVK